MLLLQFNPRHHLDSPRLFYSLFVHQGPRDGAKVRLLLGDLGVRCCRVFPGNGRLCNADRPLPFNRNHDQVKAFPAIETDRVIGWRERVLDREANDFRMSD